MTNFVPIDMSENLNLDSGSVYWSTRYLSTDDRHPQYIGPLLHPWSLRQILGLIYSTKVTKLSPLPPRIPPLSL